MLSNQVNWVLLGSSEQGFMTIQVGPFSALERTKWNPYCPSWKGGAVSKVDASLPDHALLLRHVGVLGGHPSQEAGRAPTLSTANAHKVSWSHHVSGCVSRNLVSDHCLWADPLEDLREPKKSQSNYVS